MEIAENVSKRRGKCIEVNFKILTHENGGNKKAKNYEREIKCLESI